MRSNVFLGESKGRAGSRAEAGRKGPGEGDDKNCSLFHGNKTRAARSQTPALQFSRRKKIACVIEKGRAKTVVLPTSAERVVEHRRVHNSLLLVGEGQGGIVVAMASFPMILERACRERAPTEQQMKEGREAWSGVAAAFVVDPVVVPTTNNGQGHSSC